MPNMTFQEEGDYIVCYIDNVEVSRAKKTADGTSTAEVIDIINDQIKANPTLSGTEPNLTGLQTGDTKYAVPQGGGSSLMSDIVDANGNPRFVEGEFNLNSGTYSGFTFTYNRWSLSGTHLMIVIAGTCVTGANLLGKYASFEFPAYIIDKIIPQASSSTIIEYKDVYFKELQNFGTPDQMTSMHLSKENGKIYINSGLLNANTARYFRVQFDLLIDAS